MGKGACHAAGTGHRRGSRNTRRTADRNEVPAGERRRDLIRCATGHPSVPIAKSAFATARAQAALRGLTSREREVACLVAQGKSNRAIADELVVGVSTVEAEKNMLCLPCFWVGDRIIRVGSLPEAKD